MSKEKTNIEKNVNDHFLGMRVYHGGSWFDAASDSRVSHRDTRAPSYPIKNLGFRLVLQKRKK